MNPLRLNKNKSTVFVLPMVFSDKKCTEIVTEDFKNAYIADFDNAEYDDYLTVVTENEVTRHNIPSEFLNDMILVFMGKYQETSEEYKKAVTQFWELDSDSYLYEILYGDGQTDEELLPPFNLSDEIYNLGVPE